MKTYYKIFDKCPETGKLYPAIVSKVVDFYPRNTIITRPKGWGPFAAFEKIEHCFSTHGRITLREKLPA